MHVYNVPAPLPNALAVLLNILGEGGPEEPLTNVKNC